MTRASQKWLQRAAPWVLPVGIIAVWQLASQTGWLSTLAAEHLQRAEQYHQREHG